jgi:hypothetical protein
MERVHESHSMKRIYQNARKVNIKISKIEKTMMEGDLSNGRHKQSELER